MDHIIQCSRYLQLHVHIFYLCMVFGGVKASLLMFAALKAKYYKDGGCIIIIDLLYPLYSNIAVGAHLPWVPNNEKMSSHF